MTNAPPGAVARAVRLRAPVLVTLWALIALEALGGLVIFFARLAAGRTPGETLHVAGGAALLVAYASYLWGHWGRVAPMRRSLDHALGLIAALSLGLTQLSGLWLGFEWWRAHERGVTAVAYTSVVSAAHNVMSMFVLTFVGAHLGAVLRRDARARAARASR